MLTKEFLESKYRYHFIPSYGDCVYKASDGNISVQSDKVLSFIEYNLLPGQDGQLDGHYKFYVNIETFEYMLYQYAYYGSLTYTTPARDNNWVTNLIPREIERVESIIAYKLMHAYHRGESFNLSDRKSLIEGGYCNSLITDYRGYIWCDLKPNERSEKDLEAIKKLDPTYKIKQVKKLSTLDKEGRREFSIEYSKKVFIPGVEYFIPINVVYTDNTLDTLYIKRTLIGEHMHWFNILNKEKIILNNITGSFKGDDEDIISIIPKFIESL